MQWTTWTAEVLGLALCAIGLAYGAFQVAAWFGIFVLGASLVAAVQVVERVSPPVTPPAAVDGDS